MQGLDYFGARYFSGGMGRFTSPDPTLSSAHLENPRSWNRSNSFYDQIEQMMYIGITDGCSLSPPMYCPAANTTNAEMAVFTMAARSYILTGSAAAGHAGDFPYPTTPQCFPDVPSTDPYFPFVQALAQLNVIPCAGVSGPAFGEQNAITRIQAVPYAVRGILGEQSY
jgi:hypothetical protein